MPKRALFLPALVAAMLAGLLAVFAPTASAAVVTTVTADTYVQLSTPDTTNGTRATMSATNSATGKRYSYLKVDVPAVPAGENVDGYTLNLYASTAVPGATLTVDLVGNGWTETGLTWNNQPAVTTPNIGSAAMGSSNSWLSIPLTGLTPSTTVSLLVRSSVNTTAFFSTKETGDGNAATLTMLTSPAPPVQNPTASNSSTCGHVAVSYATGSGDNTASTFVTTVDGTQVDNEVVSAPSGNGGYNGTLTEDSSGGSATVAVTGNGSPLTSFEVNTDCVQPPTADFRFGLNAASADWGTYYNDLNSAGGITVRRIFATSTSEQMSQVNSAVNAGLIPWVSIKLTSAAITNPASADALVTQYANDYAAALPAGGVMYATIWHEANNGDMTAAQFGAMQTRLAPILASHANIKVGAILTSFQLVNNTSTDDGPNFNDFLTQEKPLLANGTFSFFGIDAYEDDGLNHEPLENLAATETALNNAGVASSVPVYIGEFQTHPGQGAELADTLDAFLADPRLKVACLFLNASKWLPFEAGRHDAFKAALLDPRVIH